MSVSSDYELPAAESSSVLPAEANEESVEYSGKEQDLAQTNADSQKEMSNELSSIEREIAEMHECDPDLVSPVRTVDNFFNGRSDSKMVSDVAMSPYSQVEKLREERVRENDGDLVNRENTQDSSEEVPIIPIGDMDVDAFDRDELIAVLKGIDSAADEQEQILAEALQQNEKAEGETQFMDETGTDLTEGVTIEGEGQFQILEVIDDEVMETKSDPTTDRPDNNDPLAISLSNIDDAADAANTHSAGNAAQKWTPEEERAVAMEQMATLQSRERQRRRKQDIKSLCLENTDCEPTIAAVLSEVVTAIPSKSYAASIATKNVPVGDEENISKDDAANTSVGRYKRTRVIKRKIIWDPDAPETQISYARFARKETTTKNNVGVTAEKASSTASKANASSIKRARINDKQSDTSNDLSSSAADETDDLSYQSPITNGVHSKKKKITEIDRLMRDEGAVNMLTALKTEQNKSKETPSDKLRMRNRSGVSSEKELKTTTVVKATTPTKGKRGPKPKASTWDYVYQQNQSDESMIVRRHSNSSQSSKASFQGANLGKIPKLTKQVNNSSVSGKKPAKPVLKKSPAPSTAAKKNVTKLKQQTKANNRTFEFAKPYSESNQKNARTNTPKGTNEDTEMTDIEEPDSSRRCLRTATRQADKIKSPKENFVEEDYSEHGEVEVKKFGKVAQINFSTHSSKQEYTFSAKLMVNLCNVLHELSDDSDCNAVVVTTNAAHFCQGIDFKDLSDISPQKRENFALELATAAKNYLKTLATFPKPLIAGISGNNVNLGVTQLPLFDIVVGSDRGTYETNYAKIGQVPEGFCIWNNMSKISDAYKTKLFWLCEKLNATESISSGLVNMITNPDDVIEEALLQAQKIASMSPQTFVSMKKTCANKHLDVIFTALNEEFDSIVKQWTSPNCFEFLDDNNVS